MENELLTAASQGDERICRMLLDKGANCNVFDSANKVTPLLCAIIGNNSEVALLLLARGASPNLAGHNNTTPLYQAVSDNRESVVDALLAMNADPNIATLERQQTPLHAAAIDGNVAIIRKLLATGKVVVDARDADNMTSLHRAARLGHIDAVRMLLDAGAAPNAVENKTGSMPIHNAAAKGYTAIVELFVDRIPELKEACWSGNEGITPLALAATGGHADMVKSLLKRGANSSATDKIGRHLFLHAIFSGHSDCIKALLEGNRFLADAKDSKGRSALHVAAEKGNNEVVAMLISYGAYVNTTDDDGATPRDYAEGEGHFSTASLLEEHGGECYE